MLQIRSILTAILILLADFTVSGTMRRTNCIDLARPARGLCLGPGDGEVPFIRRALTPLPLRCAVWRLSNRQEPPVQTRAMFTLLLTLLVGGCSTFTTPRYSISADANVALKSFGLSSVAMGSFSGPPSFDSFCRGAGPLAPVDGMSHTEYIRRAFEAELKVAGIHASQSPRIILSGSVSRLDFSSTRSLTGGAWSIDLTLTSSNGKSMSMSESYAFESGFGAETACKQTAEAFMPAVQNLIGKTVQSPVFRPLLQ